MLNTPHAVSILRALPSWSRVLTSAGIGTVMVSARGKVTVLIDNGPVLVFDRWQVDDLTQPGPHFVAKPDGDVGLTAYTDADIAWFRKPATERHGVGGGL